MIYLIILSLFCPVLSFPISLYAIRKDKKNWRACIFGISMFFAVMAYCYTPSHENDLTRYWQMTRNISWNDFSCVFSYKYQGGSDVILYLFNFMTWVIGRIGDLHLLPAISTFVVYYIAMYVTCYIGECSDIEWKYVFYYVLFIIFALGWIDVASSVRNIMAFSMAGMAVFRDVYQKNRNLLTIIFYVFPIFLHPSAALFIILRLCVNIFAKYKLIIFLIVAFINPIVDFVYNNFAYRFDNTFIKWFINKANRYFNDTSSNWGLAVQASRYYTIQRVAYVSFAVLFCTYHLINNYMIKKEDSLVRQSAETIAFREFAFMIGLFVIACASMLTPEYWRFYDALIIFGGIIYIPYVNCKMYKKTSKIIYIYIYAFCSLCFAMYIYSINTHCEGKFDIFSSMIMTCPIYVVFKDFFLFFK